jgi:type VI secretion system protein ImpB
MAKEGSVAPKERVNITYKPATGDAQEEIELPLKLLMMGDFTLKRDETPLEDRKAINIDKDNFNDVMKSQNLSLNLVVPNKLAEDEGEEMALNLNFDNLKDFSPEAVAEQVPELKALLNLREALTAVKGPLGNVPAFKKKIQALMKDDAAKEKILKELGLEEGEGGE